MYRLFFGISLFSILACSEAPTSILPVERAPIRLDAGSYSLVLREVVSSSCGAMELDGLSAIPAELSGRSPVEMSIENWEFSGRYRSGVLELSGQPHRGMEPVEPGRDTDSDLENHEEGSDDEGRGSGAEERDCRTAAPEEDGDDSDAPRGDDERPRCGTPEPSRDEATLVLRPQSENDAKGLLEVTVDGCHYSVRVDLLPARADRGDTGEPPRPMPADDDTADSG